MVYQYGAAWVYHRLQNNKGPQTLAEMRVHADIPMVDLLTCVYAAQEKGWVRLERDPDVTDSNLQRVCLGAKAPE